jgi:hypothetical protein
VRRTLLLAALGIAPGAARASDHAEADALRGDAIADLDDLYAWHTRGGKIVVVLTFGGAQTLAYGPVAALDDQVLYGVHLDEDADGVAEHDVWIRFGQNSVGAWGVQLLGIPGGNAVVEGPVDVALDAGNGLQAQAGTFDDPFFMDFAGYLDTVATGTIRMIDSRDSFAGKNVDAIVFELDAGALGSTAVKIWATTGRR